MLDATDSMKVLKHKMETEDLICTAERRGSLQEITLLISTA